jgi:hypothetical protein
MYAVPAAPCPETNDSRRLEVGHPPTAAAPAEGVVLDVLDAAALALDAAVLVLPAPGLAAAVLWRLLVALAAAALAALLELELPPLEPQAATTSAVRRAGRARLSFGRRVLTAPTLASLAARQRSDRQSAWGAQRPR